MAVVGHRSAGKTTLGDGLLFRAGVTRTRGDVATGTSLLDHGPEELRRKTTLGCSFAWLPWGAHTLFLVDTPGHDDLAFERDLALSGVDGALLVVHGVHGVQVGTRQAWSAARRVGCPVLAVITHADRLSSDEIDRLRRDLGRLAGRPAVLVHELLDDGLGVRRLIDGSAWRVDDAGLDQRSEVGPGGPGRERLVEAVAESDDALIDAYLEHLDLPPERVDDGLRAATSKGVVLPVALLAAPAGVGLGALLTEVVHLLPAPAAVPPWTIDPDPEDRTVLLQQLATRVDAEGRTYQVFRVWRGDAKRDPVLMNGRTGVGGRVRKGYALRGPRRSVASYHGAGAMIATWEAFDGRPGDTWCEGAPEQMPPLPQTEPVASALLRSHEPPARLASALSLLQRVDAAIVVGRDELTGAAVIRGTGETHLARALAVLRDRLGLGIEALPAPIAYREVPAREAQGVTAVVRRSQPDEHAEVTISVRPIEPGQGGPRSGRRFVCSVGEDVLPVRFVHAAEDGVWDAAQEGPLAGYPLAGIEVTLTGGEYDALCSEEAHFRDAGARALRAALNVTGTLLVEPWSAVAIDVPADAVGATLAEVVSRGGRIVGLDVAGAGEVDVRAELPERGLLGFGSRLKGLTGGAGAYQSHRLELRPLPAAWTAEAVESSPFQRQRLGARRA